MAWQREYHHINLDEGEHRIGLINREALTRAGTAARYTIQIQMGAGAFEYQVGKNVVRIKLGGDFTVAADGTLRDSEGAPFDPRGFEKALTAELDLHHSLLRSYARRHNVPEFKPEGAGGR